MPYQDGRILHRDNRRRRVRRPFQSQQVTQEDMRAIYAELDQFRVRYHELSKEIAEIRSMVNGSDKSS